jgi:hypothetical protein
MFTKKFRAQEYGKKLRLMSRPEANQCSFMCFEIMDFKLFDPLSIVSASRRLIMLKPGTGVLPVAASIFYVESLPSRARASRAAGTGF